MIPVEPLDTRSILRRVSRNVGLLIGATGVAAVCGFISVILNARALGAEGLGVLALLQYSAALIGGLFSLGSQQPVIKLGRQMIGTGDLQRFGALVGLAFMADTGAALLAGVAALAVIVCSPNLLDLSPALLGLAVIYATVIFFSGTAGSNGVFRLLNRFHYIAAIQAINAVAILCLAIALYFGEAALKAYVMGYAAIHTVTGVATLALAAQLLQENHIPLRVTWRSIRGAGVARQYWSYAWTSGATSAIDTTRRNADALLLGFVFGPAIVGIYSAIKQLSGALNKLMAPISSAVFPEIAALATTNARARAQQVLKRLASVGIGFGLCGCLLMALIGEQVLRIGFGQEFADGYGALIILMIAVSLSLSSASFGGFVQAFNSPVLLLKIYIGAFVAYVIVVSALVPRLGMEGAAAAQATFALMVWVLGWRTLTSEGKATDVGMKASEADVVGHARNGK